MLSKMSLKRLSEGVAEGIGITFLCEDDIIENPKSLKWPSVFAERKKKSLEV